MKPSPDATTERTQADAEGRLLAIVRRLPLGDLRQLFAEMDGLLAPTCAESQADGVPCPDAHSACATCARARSVLESVRRRVRIGLA
jgi:hypothetical protein